MNLLFIGGGNMATALIGGLSKGASPQPAATGSAATNHAAAIKFIHVIEPNDTARAALIARFEKMLQDRGITFSADAKTCPAAFGGAATDSSDPATWVILAVKPQHMKQACTQADETVRTYLASANIISIAAGIHTKALSDWCMNERIVRAMPNTPALVNRGVTGLYAHPALSAAAKDQAQALMSAVGSVVWVGQEPLIDAVTALSGSGPAYVFKFIEALSAAGQSMGLSAEQSQQLSIETLAGALALLQSSGETPAGLREKVTSKGGTTAAALASLDQQNFMGVIAAALTAARDRGAEMTKEFQ
jgi:pyrroline-5-carboxylate reductase